MAVKIEIQHNREAWRKIFTSPEMRRLVDETGERIAKEAGDHFSYEQADWADNAAVGVVVADKYTGSIQEATEKTLTKAVHK